MGSLYRRGKTYWTNYYLPDGRRVQVSLKTRDRATARQKLRELELEVDAGHGEPLTKAPIAQVLDEFEKHAHARLATKTAQTHMNRLRKLVELTGAKRLEDLSSGAVNNVLVALVRAGRDPKTANDWLSTVSALFKWAIVQNYARHNPAKKVPRFSTEEKPVRSLTYEEAERVLEAARATQLFPMIATAIYTGARFGELARFRWEDFKWSRSVVQIKKAKSKKFREVPLAEDLRTLLNPFRRPAGLCFPTQYGEAYKTVPRSLLEEVQRESHVPNLGWHLFRHTFASWHVQNGVSLYKVQKWLGHSTPAMTQRYAHLAPGHDRDIDKGFSGFAPVRGEPIGKKRRYAPGSRKRKAAGE